MPLRGIFRYEFRHSSYHLPKVTHEFAKNCLSYNLIKVINNTTRNIEEKITTHSQSGFSLYIKTMLLQKYSLVCDITNCYVCQKNSSDHIK